MRQKNIRRAAEALFESQGDDKNKVLASFIENKEVRKRVADQGRALLILERLCLPQGKFSFSMEEIHESLLRKLEKKGHRIQEDDETDTEQYAQEKEKAKRERLAMVDNVLGKTIEDLKCGNLSPWNQYPCILPDGHDKSTEQAEFIHRSENGVTWGYGGFAEGQEKEPDLTEEEKQELEEALEIQKRLLDDLPEVSEVEDSGPIHKDEFGNIVEGIKIQPYSAMTKEDIPEFPEIPELPDVAWQLIGQAYIDGIRAGRR